MRGIRKPPPVNVARAILVAQMGRCGYCNASLIDRPMHWDHFIPFAYLGRNPQNNWVAACTQCNLTKSSRMWTDEESVHEFCYEMTVRHGELGDGWPEGAEAAWPWIKDFQA